jgi:hypothetical protein
VANGVIGIMRQDPPRPPQLIFRSNMKRDAALTMDITLVVGASTKCLPYNVPVISKIVPSNALTPINDQQSSRVACTNCDSF